MLKFSYNHIIIMSNEVKFGLNLAVFGEFDNTSLEKRLRFDDLKEMVTVGEDGGFESLWIPDHIVNPTGSSPSPHGGSREFFHRDCFESWTTLSALSSLTNKMRLGNIVLCNLFRHPSLLAKMTSTLDIISNGRLIFSLGAGWFKEECIAYGIPWFPYKERLARFREAIIIVKSLWNERVSNFKGEYYEIKDAYLEPKPIQKPHPPIWIGGESDTIKDTVAEFADGWDLTVSPDVLQKKIESLKIKCESLGRNYREIEISRSFGIFKADSYEDALKISNPVADIYHIDRQKYASMHLLGTDKNMINQIEKFVESGAKIIIVRLEKNVDQVRWFCDSILSTF